MITIATYYNFTKAELDKTRLEDSRIEAFIADEAKSTIGYGPAMIGGVRLQVRDEDAERARAVLAQWRGLDLPGNAEFEDNGTPRESFHEISAAELRELYRKLWRAILRLVNRIRS